MVEKKLDDGIVTLNRLEGRFHLSVDSYQQENKSLEHAIPVPDVVYRDTGISRLVNNFLNDYVLYSAIWKFRALYKGNWADLECNAFMHCISISTTAHKGAALQLQLRYVHNHYFLNKVRFEADANL